MPQHIWDRIRDEFTLPTAADLQGHFQALGDPDAMQRAVRVFVDEETLCPGFQIKDGLLREPVLLLFEHAMALKVPHNVFAAWMVTPLPTQPETRPVDALDDIGPLFAALADFANIYRPSEQRR
ncbi:hypothetical protein RM50_04460 [Pseudarthrobacter phenanthrenivorans]|uniref:Uncharacterized protein n=1 Tax=Pseudarthrobacter phenanthrenivorans TaxID=361575 RepID=A0A0B4DQ04_PSEPS|nr:hypothetical protein RM50_04460 [Pseudarthrobacter phenanthrenivorans]